MSEQFEELENTPEIIECLEMLRSTLHTYYTFFGIYPKVAFCSQEYFRCFPVMDLENPCLTVNEIDIIPNPNLKGKTIYIRHLL
jgi:hypothetical protein